MSVYRFSAGPAVEQIFWFFTTFRIFCKDLTCYDGEMEKGVYHHRESGTELYLIQGKSILPNHVLTYLVTYDIGA